jgi:hypothetical protein
MTDVIAGAPGALAAPALVATNGIIAIIAQVREDSPTRRDFPLFSTITFGMVSPISTPILTASVKPSSLTTI